MCSGAGAQGRGGSWTDYGAADALDGPFGDGNVAYWSLVLRVDART